jgi:4-amino-4-deoxy-L-arabinose transferase-like glycosyltransferase
LLFHRFTGADFAIVCLLLLLAATTRLHNVLTVEVQHPIRADAREYLAIAYNLLENGIYSSRLEENPTTFIGRTPGYPLLLVPVFASADTRGELVRNAALLNAALGTLLVLLTYLVFRLFSGNATAVTGALAVLFNPHLVSLESYVLTETAFAFCLLLGIYLLAWSHRNYRTWCGIAAGCFLGYAALIRPSFLLFVLFLLPFLYLIGEPRPHWRARCATQLLIGFTLVCLPWVVFTARNHTGPTGEFNSTTTFAAGLYPGHVYEDPNYYGYPYRDPAAPDINSSYSKSLAQLAKWVVEDPAKYLHWFVIGKPLSLWQWDIIQGEGDVFVYPVSKSIYKSSPLYRQIKSLYRTLHTPSLAAMLAGLLLVLWRMREPALVVAGAAVVYLTLMHITFVPYPRYSIPLRPEMYLLGLGGIHLLLQRWLRPRA